MTESSPRHPTRARARSSVLDWALPLGVLVAALLLTLSFRSPGPDDFDSYSFVLALDEFDLALQQPQPPGFPVYIALARTLLPVTPGPTAALTLLSALSGACAAMLVCRIGQVIDPDHPMTSVLGALLFTMAPVSWLTSGKALSDMPGMAFTLWGLTLWLAWRLAPRTEGRRPRMYVAALVTGISLGVRPQNALPLGLLALFLCIEDLVDRRLITRWIGAAALVGLGMMAWLVPTAVSAGGLGAYADHVRDHAAHVGRADSLLGMAIPIGQALRIRLFALGDTLLTSLTHAGLPLMHPGGIAHHLGLAVIALPGLVFADWRRRRTRLLALWAAAVLAQILLFETLDRPRLLLPALPPLALLIASGWQRLAGRSRTGTAVVGAISVAMMVQTVPWVAMLSSIPAPPSQATDYVRSHTPADRTVVAAAGSFRAAQVELPEYRLLYLYTFDPVAAAATLASGYDYVAVIDRDLFTTDAMSVLAEDGTRVVMDDRTFSRDRRVHTQHDQVRVQVLTRPELVPPEALALPSDGCIDLGTDGDGRYLGQGWYRTEEIGGTTGRWAGPGDVSTLRFTPATPEAGILTLRAMAYPEDQTVAISIDGQSLGSVSLGRDWSLLEISVPKGLALEGASLTLELAHAKASSPSDLTAGVSSDRRTLAAAYDVVCFAVPEDSPHSD